MGLLNDMISQAWTDTETPAPQCGKLKSKKSNGKKAFPAFQMKKNNKLLCQVAKNEDMFTCKKGNGKKGQAVCFCSLMAVAEDTNLEVEAESGSSGFWIVVLIALTLALLAVCAAVVIIQK